MDLQTGRNHVTHLIIPFIVRLFNWLNSTHLTSLHSLHLSNSTYILLYLSLSLSLSSYHTHPPSLPQYSTPSIIIMPMNRIYTTSDSPPSKCQRIDLHKMTSWENAGAHIQSCSTLIRPNIRTSVGIYLLAFVFFPLMSFTHSRRKSQGPLIC